VADPSVFAPEWDIDAPELGRRVMRLGQRAAASELGVSLFELDPGGAVSPMHIHHANEEMLVVLSGRPTLCTPDGARQLDPGAVVSFPRGEAGAHQIANPGSEPARVLVFSTMNLPEVTELVNTGTTMVSASRDTRKTFPAGSAQDFTQLWREAFDADRTSRPRS
jgi:uncharacterized cupin superfamily protein